jgi:phosphohistidine phosphatase
MHLYIMRHGIAYEHHEWSGSDATRPLTDKGKDRTLEVAEKLVAEKKLRIEALFSSPLVRARETAEIVSKVTGLKVQILEALACGSSLRTLQKSFPETLSQPERIMLVGHEPDCGVLVGELVGDSRSDFSFKKAGVAHLDGTFKPGGMKLKWLLSPRDVLNKD